MVVKSPLRTKGLEITTSATCIRVLLSISALAFGAALIATGFRATSVRAADTPEQESLSPEVIEIIKNRFCPCGCRRFLPGGSTEPSCFGCSVGKAEVTRVVEGLAAGRRPADMILEFGEPVTVDVYSDYTDPALQELWSQAMRVAGEFNQHRVVVRAPGETEEARRALRAVECARSSGLFSGVQRAIIAHDGPWDTATLVELAVQEGVDRTKAQSCITGATVRKQWQKDRQHAAIYGVPFYPSVSVNRVPVDSTKNAIRKAIQEVLRDDSI